MSPDNAARFCPAISIGKRPPLQRALAFLAGRVTPCAPVFANERRAGDCPPCLFSVRLRSRFIPISQLRFGQEQLQIHCVEPLIELLTDLPQMRNFLKSELLVQPDAGFLICGDVRKNGTKALLPGGINQFRKKPASNPLTEEIVTHIDGVFQGAGDGISGSE
jgi:hypothetical protein